MTESEAIEIAKQNIRYFVNQYDYLPKTEEELEKFIIHGWVLEAMQDAFDAGREFERYKNYG